MNYRQLQINVICTLVIFMVMQIVNIICGSNLNSGWFVFMWMVMTGLIEGV